MLLVLAAEGMLGRSCSLHACTVVMLLSQLLLRARRLGKMICSDSVWPFILGCLFFSLLYALTGEQLFSSSGLAPLAGEESLVFEVCCWARSSELKVLPDFSKRTCLCAWAEAMLELTLQWGLALIWIYLQLRRFFFISPAFLRFAYVDKKLPFFF